MPDIPALSSPCKLAVPPNPIPTLSFLWSCPSPWDKVSIGTTGNNHTKHHSSDT